MRQVLKSGTLCGLIFLGGCQALPSPISDLRPQKAAPSSASGTPLAEILARANAEEPVETEPSTEATSEAAVSASDSQAAKLSIGLSPMPETPEVAEATVRSETPATEQPATAATPETERTDADMPEVVEQSEPLAVATNEPPPLAPLSISDQLNWLPSLDDTLSAMNGRVAETAQLDEKIDALMSLAYVVDAQLYIAFRDLLDRLDESEAQLLLAEQREWLAQRKENLTRAYLEFKADKAGRYNAAQAFLRNSHQRMREIQARLQQLKTG